MVSSLFSPQQTSSLSTALQTPPSSAHQSPTPFYPHSWSRPQNTYTSPFETDSSPTWSRQSTLCRQRTIGSDLEVLILTQLLQTLLQNSPVPGGGLCSMYPTGPLGTFLSRQRCVIPSNWNTPSSSLLKEGPPPQSRGTVLDLHAMLHRCVNPDSPTTSASGVEGISFRLTRSSKASVLLLG